MVVYFDTLKGDENGCAVSKTKQRLLDYSAHRGRYVIYAASEGRTWVSMHLQSCPDDVREPESRSADLPELTAPKQR